MYDLIIIGGGPAGAAAGVYAGRKQLKTLLITREFGGQSIVSDGIENWIGEKKIAGFELAQKLEEHVRAQPSVEIKLSEKVESLSRVKDQCVSCCDWKNYSAVADQKAGDKHCAWEVTTDKDKYEAKALVVASGARRRKLKVPGESNFDGKGVAYCSTCDAPLFKDKTVVVVGGGNAGLEAVIDLLPYASEIHLLARGKKLTGDQKTQEEIKKSKKVKIIFNAEVEEILGDKLVSALKYKDSKSNEVNEILVQGVFIEIGSVPNSDIVKGLVDINNHGEIIVDHRTAATSAPGIFAAGDITDEIYKQNSTAAGDAVTATLSAYNYLLDIKKQTPAAEAGE